MRQIIMNEINGESIESFIVIYNRSRKYCIDKIDQIRCKYKEIDNKLDWVIEREHEGWYHIYF